MDEITEKFTRDDVVLCSPFRLASLVRQSARAKNGDKINFLGHTLVTHSTRSVGPPCNMCCFDNVYDLCDFVSCVPEERKDGSFAYYTIESKGKEVSHE